MATWTPNLHPRWPKGHPQGGQFIKKGTPAWHAAVQAQKPPAPGTPAPVKKAAPAKAAKATVAKAAKAAAPAVPVIPKGKAAPRPVKAAPAPKVAKTPAVKVSTATALKARGKTVDRLVSGGRDSSSLHMTGGRWTSSRAALHQQIVDEIWKAQNGDQVPQNRSAILLGGPVGAGKSTVLAQHHGKGTFLMIAPDDMKEALAAHDAIPHVTGGGHLSPMERSALVHAESLHLAAMLAERAYQNGTDVVFDGTMGDAGNVQARVSNLRKKGYKVHALFSEAPLGITRKRAADRYVQGQQEFERGRGNGGRLVPDWVITATQGSISNFDSMRRQKGFFDSYEWYVNDRNGVQPILKRSG